VELNRAVLWSYQASGVRISDHHTEARRFLAHVERERRAGRRTPADWTWIVPPMSGAATPVFHRYYHEADQRPNFYLDPAARELAQYGRVASPTVADSSGTAGLLSRCPFAPAPAPAPAPVSVSMSASTGDPAPESIAPDPAPSPRRVPRQPVGREVFNSLR
jgi:nitric-oxide synthase